jgi:aspartate/glutamate racemase
MTSRRSRRASESERMAASIARLVKYRGKAGADIIKVGSNAINSQARQLLARPPAIIHVVDSTEIQGIPRQASSAPHSGMK